MRTSAGSSTMLITRPMACVRARVRVRVGVRVRVRVRVDPNH